MNKDDELQEAWENFINQIFRPDLLNRNRIELTHYNMGMFAEEPEVSKYATENHLTLDEVLQDLNIEEAE